MVKSKKLVPVTLASPALHFDCGMQTSHSYNVADYDQSYIRLSS